MKAMLLHKHAPAEHKPLRPTDLPEPRPGSGEILLRISACGVCHTDLDIMEGRLTPSRWPMVPGHQVVGRVEQCGVGADRFEVGQRVGVMWLFSSCRQCRYCTSGRENLCPRARWTGQDAYGGYAEQMVVGAEFAQPIPEAFSDAAAAPLLCAGVIGYRALRLAKLDDDAVLGLYGFGACGHIVIQVVKHCRPSVPVFIFTRSADKQALAKKLGADWAGQPDETPPQPLTRAIDFTPVGETITSALAALAPGGRLVINAIRKETLIPAMDYGKLLWWEREVKSVANITRADAAEFLPLAAEIPITPTVQEFALDRANDALLAVKRSEVAGAAVLRIGS